jgi:hypothetical protein
MKTRWRILCCLFTGSLVVSVTPATEAAKAPAFRHVRALQDARPPELEFRSDGVAVRGIAFSPDGKTLAVASASTRRIGPTSSSSVMATRC